MTIAKRVRDCRYAKGWGPDELATRAAISRTALYQIECGKTETPRAGTLRRIAEALGVSIETLLGNEEGRALEITSPPARAAAGVGAGGPPSWAVDAGHAVRYAPLSASPERQNDLARKLIEVLDSPMGDGVARIVEEAHRLLPTVHQSEAN